ncbi:MAG: bifunctional riboflavin kinase/FAD synthetase [Sedimentisphaerales bacterium]|nr:bifunctional riboflavin kinase/FAD synthetase [Sedimentisphaerales bacterium]
MRIIQSLSDCGDVSKGGVLTIGNFDGVHLGHQEILSFARQKAVQRAAQLIVMTFEPHPVAILYPEKAPGVLTPLEVKQNQLEKLGVDCLIVLRDSAELLSLSPEDFVRNVIVEYLQPSMVVEGDDFNFGATRAGNIKTLQKLGVEYGFKVHALQSKKIKLSTGQVVRVSSTMIRYMLESGHVNDANVAFGRPYRLIEKIIHGRGVGTKLGFPTLNMKVPAQVIPAEGVYAGFVYLGETSDDALNSEKRYPAVYSLGQARTYGDEFPLLIEAHLFDENVPDTAGKYMAMDFISHIRNQHKFRSPEELSSQISKDCEKAKEILCS